MKRNYWPLFFIAVFSLAFSMIVWTIYSATKVPVHEDQTFLKSYQDLKDNFNDVVTANEEFNKKYDFKIKINEKELALIMNDLFLAQRVIEKKSQHKDIFKKGLNKIVLSIVDKKSLKQIEDVDINFRISRPTNHKNTMDFTNENFKNIKGLKVLNANLPLKGNWNITATFKVANDTGYLYIKSNAY